MKKIILMLTAFVAICSLVACNDYETYGDQKEKERNAIKDFMNFRGYYTIDEATFRSRPTKTCAPNEFVYLNNSGVYMQIVREGVGRPLLDGETTDLQIRFYEQSIFDTTIVISNNSATYDPDVMTISRTGTNYTASFTYGIMSSYYSASVPSGWLVPFNYIKVDPADETGDKAKVRLIVPHTQGHSVASSNVYPYFYEITYQRTPGQ